MRIRERDGKDFDVPVFDLDSDGSATQDDAGMVPDHVVDDAAGVYPKVPLPGSLEVPVPHVHDDDDLETLPGIRTPDRLSPRGLVAETPEKTERPPRRETALERDAKKARSCEPKPPSGRPLEAAPRYAGNQAGLGATQMDDDLDQAQAQAVPFPPSPANPAWVQALLTGMSSLNQKQDSLHSTFRQLHEIVDVHAKRIHQLTEAHQNNATLHENTLARLASLETEVRELKSKSRSVSPVAPRSPVGSGAPYPRSGNHVGGREEPPENPSDMAVVFGGWLDARRSEIQAEVDEINSPLVRSTFSRLNLKLNDEMPIHEARHIQTRVVSTLKQASWKSQIPGSQDRVLWALPHRSAEKRNRIKAINYNHQGIPLESGRQSWEECYH